MLFEEKSWHKILNNFALKLFYYLKFERICQLLISVWQIGFHCFLLINNKPLNLLQSFHVCYQLTKLFRRLDQNLELVF